MRVAHYRRSCYPVYVKFKNKYYPILDLYTLGKTLRFIFCILLLLLLLVRREKGMNSIRYTFKMRRTANVSMP